MEREIELWQPIRIDWIRARIERRQTIGPRQIRENRGESRGKLYQRIDLESGHYFPYLTIAKLKEGYAEYSKEWDQAKNRITVPNVLYLYLRERGYTVEDRRYLVDELRYDFGFAFATIERLLTDTNYTPSRYNLSVLAGNLDIPLEYLFAQIERVNWQRRQKRSQGKK